MKIESINGKSIILNIIGFLPKSFETGYMIRSKFEISNKKDNQQTNYEFFSEKINDSTLVNLNPIIYSDTNLTWFISGEIIREKNPVRNLITMTFPNGTSKVIDDKTPFNEYEIKKGEFPTKILINDMGFLMITSDEKPTLGELKPGEVRPMASINPAYNAYIKKFYNLPGISTNIEEPPQFYNIWNQHNWKFYVFPLTNSLEIKENFSDTTDDIEEFSGTASNIIFFIIIIAIIAFVYFNYNRIRNLF